MLGRLRTDALQYLLLQELFQVGNFFVGDLLIAYQALREAIVVLRAIE